MEINSKDDLKALLLWSDAYKREAGLDYFDVALVESIESEIERLEELESIDLNACDGGGCTL